MGVDDGLGEAGRAFLAQTDAWLTAEKWQLEPHERTILVNAARQCDRLVEIRAGLAVLEPIDPVYARLLREERAATVELRRSIVVLGLPVGPVAEDGGPVSQASRRASAAARARWGTRAAG
jgi:hypothetical protein